MTRPGQRPLGWSPSRRPGSSISSSGQARQIPGGW